MDSSETITSLSLCTGYGGIELGLKRVIPTLRTIAYVEREGFAVANLVAKIEAGRMDTAPIWTDVKTFPSESFRDRVHLITSGYPCQPFSQAGTRKGEDDPRHLWPHILRIVGSIRPVQCFFENVEGHITLGLSTVISDLAELGYKVTFGIFSAAECGAPHSRKRVFILANAEGAGRGEEGQCQQFTTKRAVRTGEVGDTKHDGSFTTTEQRSVRSTICNDTERPDATGKFKGANNTGELADSAKFRLERFCKGTRSDGEEQEKRRVPESTGRNSQPAWPSGPREKQHEWEPPRTVKSSMGRDSDGNIDRLVRPTNRIDELRLIGNGVVPATAERAYRVLSEKLRCLKKN